MSTIVEEVPASSASPARPRAEVLRRADGLELIGEFEGSGFRDTPHLARRADGQVVQLSELLFTVAEGADGRRDLHEVAEYVSLHSGRTVTAENVALLAAKKLRPLGVLALPDGTTPELKKREPVMALRHRKPLLPERWVNAGARLFTWLHLSPVVVLVLTVLAGFDYWLFCVHGIAGGLRAVIYDLSLLLAVLVSVVVATGFHEFGHASACRYGGARPGVMGVGLYLVWPAFYCDVTDAYRLGRTGRLRTDLGGIYFNLIFALLAGGVFLATGEEAALLAAFVQHVIVLQQLLPLLRFDGYYVMTDLTGVPDILSRIRPIFRSLVHGKRHEPQVAELKSWVRVVVTAYLALLIPAMAFLFGSMIMSAPRIAATVHDSLGLQVDRLVGAHNFTEVGLGAFRLVALVMPVAAMSLSVVRVGKMAGRGLVAWSADSLARKVVATSVAAALIGGVGYIWLPNGDYQPIRPGERGTIGDAVKEFRDAPGGRPSFTPQRETMYAPVATVRQVEAAKRDGRELPVVTPGDDPPQLAAPGYEGDPAAQDPNGTVGDDDATQWPGAGETEDYSSPDSGLSDPAPSGGTTTQPGTTGTAPAPSGTTTQPAPAPPPSDSGTTTTSPDSTTTSPDSTTTSPDSTTTTPPPAGTTTAPDTTTTSPDSTTTAPMTTESAPLAPDTTTTAPDTTTTTPIP